MLCEAPAESTGEALLSITKKMPKSVGRASPGRIPKTLRTLRVSHPHTGVIMMLGSSVRCDVIEAFRAGADGIFSRDDKFEMLRKCIHAVYQGQVWASSEQLHFVVEALAESDAQQTGNMKKVTHR